jgi:hypothetical protein
MSTLLEQREAFVREMMYHATCQSRGYVGEYCKPEVRAELMRFLRRNIKIWQEGMKTPMPVRGFPRWIAWEIGDDIEATYDVNRNILSLGFRSLKLPDVVVS